jgi:hypothetical protein
MKYQQRKNRIAGKKNDIVGKSERIKEERHLQTKEIGTSAENRQKKILNVGYIYNSGRLDPVGSGNILCFCGTYNGSEGVDHLSV